MEFSNPFSSQFYTILVGPSAHPFYVHADVLAKSEVLKREVSGEWKESQEKQIIWPHWNLSAAAKFIEWLYTGDYRCPYPTKVGTGESSSQQERESLRASDSWRFGSHLFSISNKPAGILDMLRKAIPEQPLPPLNELVWIGSCKLELWRPSQAGEYEKWTTHQKWHPSELDYEEVFLTHAELYVMACTYMVDDLKSMAWQRLRSVLSKIGVPVSGSPLIGNLASLIRYTFKETGTSGNDEDPLRMLVTAFAALHFTIIQGPEIDALIMSPANSDREFSVALTSRMTRQMRYLEAKTTKLESLLEKSSCCGKECGVYCTSCHHKFSA
ncbi:MAG: hypothetical protein Q9212_002883 [Teloschistes hypoglaucus]